MHETSGKRPIPAAVLVTDHEAVPERPAPRRKAKGKPSDIPWVRIIVGGSVVWVLVVLVMAVYAVMSNRPALPDGPVIPANAVVRAEQGGPIQPVPRAEAAPAVEAFDEGEPAPVPAVPKLAFREVKQGKNGAFPPPLDVEPVDAPKADLAQGPMPREGDAVPLKNVARPKVDLNLFANCEQIRTNVLFMKDPPEAFKRARAEKKLVFMVHLSGNLEDQDFT